MQRPALHRESDVGLQLFPAIGLSEDALAEGFGGEAAVCLLHDFKDEFIHAVCTPCRPSFHHTSTSSGLRGLKRPASLTLRPAYQNFLN